MVKVPPKIATTTMGHEARASLADHEHGITDEALRRAAAEAKERCSAAENDAEFMKALRELEFCESMLLITLAQRREVYAVVRRMLTAKRQSATH